MWKERYQRSSDWLVGLILGGEGERIMLQELPLFNHATRPAACITSGAYLSSVGYVVRSFLDA